MEIHARPGEAGAIWEDNKFDKLHLRKCMRLFKNINQGTNNSTRFLRRPLCKISSQYCKVQEVHQPDELEKIVLSQVVVQSLVSS